MRLDQVVLKAANDNGRWYCLAGGVLWTSCRATRFAFYLDLNGSVILPIQMHAYIGDDVYYNAPVKIEILRPINSFVTYAACFHNIMDWMM